MPAQLDSLYIRLRPGKALGRMISHLFFQGRPLTTKHRWMNSLLMFMYRLMVHGPQLVKIQKPIFVLGTGRSGTTILGVVLSIHREIGFLDEPKLLWHIAYPDEDLIGSYARGHATYQLGADQANATVSRAMHRLYGFYLAATGSRRVLDKYPELVFRIPFVRAIFPDAKFLFLVRNGWDTVHSIALWSERNGITKQGERHDWWGVNDRKWQLLVQVAATMPAFAGMSDELGRFSRNTDKAAVEWGVTMHEGLRWMDELPEQVHCVHYEKLTHHPREILQQISEFCELSSDEMLLTYGSSVLSPRPHRKPVTLHPAVSSFFETTMQLLGYDPADHLV